VSNPLNFLTSQEFALRAGVSAGTVAKWLRNGAIKGRKNGGKWAISPDELSKVTASRQTPTAPAPARAPASKPQAATASPAAKSYSIQEFSEMTYLTDFGVRKWLKEGRLEKTVDAQGNDRVDACNLENPHVKRLLR
jgi:Helix-turn-helix domain